VDRPKRRPRAEPREIAELRELKESQPELASAIDMQIELVDAQRRIRARVPLPWIQVDDEWLASQLKAGHPVVRFGDIPLDWSDFRLTLRQTADILSRYDALETDDHQHVLNLSRQGNELEPTVERWYQESSQRSETSRARGLPEGAPPGLEQVLILAIYPFLSRCAEVLTQRIDLTAWNRGTCPFCGWEPDFATITPSAERRLICGRCTAQWSFASLTCPFCSNGDKSLITSFATRDGRYRIYACDVCRRYLKAYDGRNASRPVLVGVDTIATLPLDAAALQRGYVG